MASNFNVIFPPRFYTGFDGGMNTKIPKAWILDNETPDCLNVDFGNGDAFTRGGTTKLNTASVGSFACDALYTYHPTNGSEQLLGFWGGSGYILSGTSFNAIASATSAFTSMTRVFSTEYENNIYFGNGGSIPMKWNGTDFTRHGVYAPTSACVASAASAGSALTGDYQYKVAFVNSNVVESDLSPVANVTLAGTNAYLTGIPVAPKSWGVSARYLYRTEANTSTVFNYLATIADNSTTTYTDSTPDAALGSEAPTDQGVPPNYSVILYHADRLFMIDPATNWVWYTDVGNPYVVAATSFIRAGDQTSDIPVSLGIYDNYLMIFCRKSTYCVYMPSPDETGWVTVKIRSPYGCKSPLSVINVQNRLMFAAMEGDKFVGFGALAAEGLDQIATVSQVGAVGGDLVSQNIEHQMFDVNTTYLQNIVAFVHKNKAYIALNEGTTAVNDAMWLFDFSRTNLTKDQKYTWAKWNGLAISQMAVLDGKLYYASQAEVGYVYEMNTQTYSDDGAAIDSYIWTKEFSGNQGHETFWKDWRFVNILYELVGGFYMGITTRVDSDASDGVEDQINCDPSSSLWDVMVWDVDNWEAGKNDSDFKKSIGVFSGKRIQFKFSNQNTVNQNFRVIGLSLTYNLKGRR